MTESLSPTSPRRYFFAYDDLAEVKSGIQNTAVVTSGSANTWGSLRAVMQSEQ